MIQPPPPAAVPAPSSRPVLFWEPESDRSHVQADVGQAARFLAVPEGVVVAAIHSGEPVGGWFVDWAAAGAS